MEDKNVIYGLYCVCENCSDKREWIRYIGQTRVGMKERFRGHMKPYRMTQPYPVDRWKTKHGMENIRYRVLEVLEDPSDLDAAEVKWIEHYETFVDWKKGGLNFTLGGQGWAGKAEEVIEKIRVANSRDSVPWAKINREKATQIRQLYREGVTTRELGERFGITQHHVSSVLNNTVWVDPDYRFEKFVRPPKTLEERGSYLLSREEAVRMRDLYKSDNDLTYEDMSNEFGVEKSLIIKILNNHTYYDPDYTPGKPMGEAQKRLISERTRGKKKPPGHGAKVSAAIRGSNHGMSKLNEEKVIEIRKLKKLGVSTKEISEKFGVRDTQINRICNGARWGHIREGLDD